MKKPVNKLFPGRPNYRGPKSGWFAFVHHGMLFEPSHDIQERIAYIREHKPKWEQPVRLRDMMYLGLDLSRKLTRLRRDKMLSRMNRDKKLCRMVLDVVEAYNPGHGWSEKHCSLVYPVTYKKMTGVSWEHGGELKPGDL